MSEKEKLKKVLVPMPEKVSIELKKLALDAGLGFTEYIRTVLYNHVTYGGKNEPKSKSKI